MAQFNDPLLISTARRPGFSGDVRLSPNAIEAAEPYYRRTAVYGRPSEQPSTGSFREHVVAMQRFHISPPDRAEFRHAQKIWGGAPSRTSRSPVNSSVAWQTHRTFGGVSQPYYQVLAAPTLNDVARYMGGVINVN
jgi:hypothetical protein